VAGGVRDRPQAPEGREDDHLSYTFFEVGGTAAGARQPRQGARHERRPEGRDRRKGSFGQTMRAVGWSFFGVRKSADYEKDVASSTRCTWSSPAVIGAALFIVGADAAGATGCFPAAPQAEIISKIQEIDS
jgi:hypothetical protein